MSYGPPTRRRSLKGPAWVLGIGLALVALGVGAWVVAWVRYGDTPAVTSREAGDVRDRFDAEVEAPGEVEVDLDRDRYLVYAVVPDGGEVQASGRVEGLTVEVVTPEGDALPSAAPDVEAPSTATFVGTGTDIDLVLLDEVVPPDHGDHTLVVEGESPEVVAVGIVPAVERHAGADAALMGGVLFVLGVLAGCFGSLLALAGAIWLLAARTAR
jgi:hypothetical protein